MNTAFIIIIGVLLLYILFVFFFGGQKSVTPVAERQEIPLSDIAKIWADGQRSGKMHIKDIAPLWRKSTVTAADKSEEYLFRYTRIERWFNIHILKEPWFTQAEAHIEICYQILRMLEEEDPCSSVVNPANDVETSWDSTTYSLLSQTSLLDHSLHVAERAITLLIDAEAHHIIPDAVIAALGHDIGKLPSNKSNLYSLGEHPLAAGRVLAEIALFKELSRKEDISKAIKHHHSRPDGLLGKTLKKADQKARQDELDEAVEQQPKQIVSEITRNQLVDNQLPDAQPVSEGGLARKADADIYGDTSSTPAASKSSQPGLINISTWFDAQTFLDELKPYINRVKNRRFMAFSMPDGVIYFQPKALEEVVRRQAESAGTMDIAVMGNKDKTMQKILFSVVERFRLEHDLIARDLIGDRYFGGYFNIKMKSGKFLKGYYTPFRSEGFGSIAEMEEDRRNKAIINNFSSVEIYQD